MIWDVIIIGGGPAGLTAGLYSSRARLRSLLVERGVMGGQIANAARVENYPGFPQGISGFELGQLMYQQATAYGLETISDEITKVELAKEYKVVKTSHDELTARALIIAGGSELKRLGVPGEEKLIGRGVSYCATCDGALFADQRVAVVGGGDAAVTEALFLTQFASQVMLIHRRNQLRASRILSDRALANPKIKPLWDTVVEEIQGEDKVNKIKLHNMKTGESWWLELSGVFVYVGLRPNTDYLRGVVPLSDNGEILTNHLMQTQIPGIFAAGDIRYQSMRQAIIAAGDGAIAALSAERFIGGV